MKTRALCPHCGSVARCYWRDTDEVNNANEYTRYCEICGNIERKIQNGSSPTNENEPTDCPFCGKGLYAHEETPDELLGYRSRYLPLHTIDFDGQKLRITVRDNTVVLENDADGFPFPPKILDLPLPRMNTKIYTGWEQYDELIVSIKTASIGPEKAVIEVAISEQVGFWCYPNDENAEPPWQHTQKTLVLVKNEDGFEARIS